MRILHRGQYERRLSISWILSSFLFFDIIIAVRYCVALLYQFSRSARRDELSQIIRGNIIYYGEQEILFTPIYAIKFKVLSMITFRFFDETNLAEGILVQHSNIFDMKITSTLLN